MRDGRFGETHRQSVSEGRGDSGMSVVGLDNG
jgi:hypothetical protein